MKAALLTLLTVYVYTVAGCSDTSSTSSPSTSSRSDPPSRCSFLDSAAQFGVLKQWLESNFTRAHQKDASVRVEVYTESICFFCKNFIIKKLFPTWMMLCDVMAVNVVPYGNTQETFDEKKYIFKCQHGEEECLGNMIQTCLINLTDIAFHIIRCMESSIANVKTARNCFEMFEPDLSWDTIMNCVNGYLGNQLMHRNALKTQMLVPPLRYVPWITINGCLELYDPDLSWDTIMSCVNGDLGNHLMHRNALKTQRLVPSLRYVPWITINGKHSEVLQGNAQESLYPLICSMIAGPKPLACTGCWRDFRSYSPKL